MKKICVIILIVISVAGNAYAELKWYAGIDGGWGTITEKHEPLETSILAPDAFPPDWGVYRSAEWIFDWFSCGCEVDGRLNVGLRGGVYFVPHACVGGEINMLQFWGSRESSSLPIPDDPIFGERQTYLLRYTNYLIVVTYEPLWGLFIDGKIGWGTNFGRSRFEYEDESTYSSSNYVTGPTTGAAIGWSQPIWRGLCADARIGWTIQWYDDNYIRTEIGTVTLGLTWRSK